MKDFLKRAFSAVLMGLAIPAVQAASLVRLGIKGAGKAAWILGKTGVKSVVPVVKNTAQTLHPHIKAFLENPHNKEMAEAALQWVKENPKHAAVIGLGGYVGYKTSGDGIVSTTVGTALGATAGASLYVNYLRLAAVTELAVANDTIAVWEVQSTLLQTELAVLKARVQTAAETLKTVIGQRDAAVHVARESQAALTELKSKITPSVASGTSSNVSVIKMLAELKGAQMVKRVTNAVNTSLEGLAVKAFA